MDYNYYSTWGSHHLGVLVDSTVCTICLDFDIWHRRLDIGGLLGMSDVFSITCCRRERFGFYSNGDFLQAIAFIQSIVILVAAHYGFGTSIELLKPDIVVRIQNVRLSSSTDLILRRKNRKTRAD